MEQAVNQFNKGLQLDTHPMVLGNDTLSDALNATFITMNGNEVVLQNDMGNRRIDNAFLPSGYLPLGMKEYGGVIYVAAYNPLTNRGLIGSFPSPLRKVNIDNTDGARIDFNDFLSCSNYTNPSDDTSDISSYYIKTRGSSSISENGSKSTTYVGILSNCSWRVVKDSNRWYTVSPLLSSKNDTLTINLEKNESGLRECTITIICNEDETILKTINISLNLYSELEEPDTPDNPIPDDPTPDDPVNPPQPSDGILYIDLGLPSGTLWGDRNIGANSVTEYGNYYGWGVLDENKVSLYESYGDTNFQHFPVNIQSNYDLDVAYHNLNGNGCTPTVEQMIELLDNCTFEHILNYLGVAGLNGYIVRGKGSYTSNSIFIPHKGHRSGVDGNGNIIYSTNTNESYYWSSEASNSPWGYGIFVKLLPGTSGAAKEQTYLGMFIRPVKNGSLLPPDNPVVPDNPETTDEGENVNIVDLGLPSGILWADRNIGAATLYDKGDYIAWGEMQPKEIYTSDNYLYYKDGSIIDGYNLKPEYDTATQRLGTNFKMPTSDDIEELCINCDYSWEEHTDSKGNIIKGARYTSRINGNSIFMPAGGYTTHNNTYDYTEYSFNNIFGSYWTSTRSLGEDPHNEISECLEFSDPNSLYDYNGLYWMTRFIGLLIRPIFSSTSRGQRTLNISRSLSRSLIKSSSQEEGKDIYYINKEYIIIPISDKMVLHTGDKFSVYSQQIGDILDYLTLPSDNINNLFTFLIGIFNSQNEFIDISDKLKLWDLTSASGKECKYYINSETGVLLNETIADSELLRARNRLAINTYSLKMSSPLYLKAIINHINNISYSIGGEITGSNTVNLEIEVTFYYNCIDDINGLTFLINFNDTLYPASEILKQKEYSLELEQYTVTYLYKIENIPVSDKEINGLKKFKYNIKFPLLHNFLDWIDNHYDPIYIESLNKSGELDLSKLDSDTLEFKGYRYYNDTSKEMTTLVINLESYPKKEEVSKLYFCTVIRDPKQIDENGNPKIVLKVIDKEYRPKTGTITKQFSYANLEKRKLYLFEFYYYNDDNEENHKGAITGLYITTPIFNGNYVGEKGTSLKEFEESGLVSGNTIHYSYDLMNNIYIDDFSKIENILLSPILNSSVSSIPIENTKNISGNYIQPLSTTLTNTSYTLLETTKIKNIINVSASIENVEIYPSEVESLLEIKTTSNPIKDIERSINEDIVSKDGNLYKYSKDLKEIKNPEIVSNNDPDVIIISEESSYLNVELNLLKIELISTINVNNNVNGSLEKKSIHCDHLISSFGNLIKKYYYGLNLMNYITLRPPYITIDWESTTYASIVVSHSLDQLKKATWNENNPNTEKVNGKSLDRTFYIDEVARDGISDFILSHCDGQLIVGEYSGDDYIVGFTPCMLSENKSALYIKMDHFKRFWLKINKREYIPIFVYGHISGSNPEFTAIDDFYNDNGAFNLIFSNIPHYYEYETGGKTLLEKIVNPNTMNKTIEFEVDSNIGIVITENILLKKGTPKYYQLISTYNNSQYSSNISEKMSFKEGIITSNEDFIDEMENLSNYHVSSAIMFGDEDDHKLLIRDCVGDVIDPLYVYYDDSEQNSLLTENVFKKSYIADKFYIPDIDIYMPELKSSRKLYGGEFGEYELINEYVYPALSERTKIIDSGDKDTPNDLSSPSNSYSKGLWDKTFILWEGSDSREHQLPLRTKNIFNKTTILKYYLTTVEINRWISYDNYIKFK